MMSHTPGPWKVAENLFGNTASYEVYANVETKSGKGGYTRICQITPRDQKANARLIAAAPDLKEALEWYAENVLNCRKITAEGDKARHDLDHDGGKRARMALERARGEV